MGFSLSLKIMIRIKEGIKMEELRELFFELVEIDAPSGFEEPMMKEFLAQLRPYVDEVDADARGNCWGIKKGTKEDTSSLALMAHTDQVGMVVSYISERGFVYFKKLGGVTDGALQGQRVKILTRTQGIIPGVIGIRPEHITTPEEARRLPPLEKMYIDIGVSSKEEAQYLGVQIGRPITYNGQPLILSNPNLIASRSVDDRAGCAALIQIAKNLQITPPECTVMFVGTAEEEIGWRGAQTVSYTLNPDMAIAVDTCPAGWQPDVELKELPVEIGKGPVLKFTEHSGVVSQNISHPVVRNLLQDTAEAEGIPYQPGAGMSGRSDAQTIQQSRGGIPTCPLCIPRRYSHSPVEVFDLNDLQHLIDLLIAAIARIKSGFSFRRI